MSHCGCVWKEQEEGPPFVECHYHAAIRVERDALQRVVNELVAIHGFPGGAHHVTNKRMEKAWVAAIAASKEKP